MRHRLMVYPPTGSMAEEREMYYAPVEYDTFTITLPAS